MFAYHLKALDQLQSRDGLLDERLIASQRSSVVKKMLKVEPFLQTRNIDFVSPLDAFIKQRKLMNNPSLSLDDLDQALGRSRSLPRV